MKYLVFTLMLFVFTNGFAQVIAIDSNELGDKGVFTVVEEMPKYQGCENLDGDEATKCTMLKIQEYAMKFVFPNVTLEDDIIGKIYISFIVDTEGKVTDLSVLKGIDELMDKAVLNYAKEMPNFASPGYYMDKPVKVKYTLPFYINLKQ